LAHDYGEDQQQYRTETKIKNSEMTGSHNRKKRPREARTGRRNARKMKEGRNMTYHRSRKRRLGGEMPFMRVKGSQRQPKGEKK